MDDCIFFHAQNYMVSKKSFVLPDFPVFFLPIGTTHFLVAKTQILSFLLSIFLSPPVVTSLGNCPNMCSPLAPVNSF